ncbi:tetratricopeptide repeat protein [Aureispira anguillae]|uniref:Tetratricopeptide repeat protein n=1 Tax=Aureispira anguillae TaxID=2864201 RepID=A0A915YKB4_9BACT|nr:tetratricopeptide repeat protein [Aureispira anguillae]BDS14789.1 tetratricopeptide repeat protein [Aureispira anguillae]
MYNLSPKCWSFILLLLSINMGVWAQSKKKTRPKESDVLLEKLFIEANREKILGNIDEAIQRYLEVLQKDNNNTAANYELARLYKRQEQYGKAIDRIEKAIALEKYNLVYSDLYASLLEKEGSFKKAADLYANLSNQYPAQEQLYFEWAYYLSKSGKADQAIKVYNNLEKRVGIKEAISMRKYKLYMKTGKAKKASQEIEQLMQAYPEEPEYIIRLANFYTSIQELEKAKTLYQKALNLDPTNPTANMAMVEFFLQNGDTARYLKALINTFQNPHQDLNNKLKALKSLTSDLANNRIDPKYEASILELSTALTQTHPNSAEANFVRGNLLFQQQEYAQAVKHYDISIRFIKNNLALWQNLLEALHLMDNQATLQKRSEEFLELYPSQANSYYYHGIALFQKEDYKKAQKEFQQAIEIAAANLKIQGHSLRYLARIYEAMNDYEKADRTFNESILMQPDDPEIIHDYAYSLAKRGVELPKAQELIKGILKRYPNNIKYTTANGFILYKQTKYTLAEQEINKALSLGGNNSPETLERYGDVLFKMGKENQAVSFWQKALDKGSSSSILQRKISTKQLYE